MTEEKLLNRAPASPESAADQACALRLAGVELLPEHEVTRLFAEYQEGLQAAAQAGTAPSVSPPQTSRMIFQDDSGNHYTVEHTAVGPVAIPHFTGSYG